MRAFMQKTKRSMDFLKVDLNLSLFECPRCWITPMEPSPMTTGALYSQFIYTRNYKTKGDIHSIREIPSFLSCCVKILQGQFCSLVGTTVCKHADNNRKIEMASTLLRNGLCFIWHLSERIRMFVYDITTSELPIREQRPPKNANLCR